MGSKTKSVIGEKNKGENRERKPAVRSVDGVAAVKKNRWKDNPQAHAHAVENKSTVSKWGFKEEDGNSHSDGDGDDNSSSSRRPRARVQYEDDRDNNGGRGGSSKPRFVRRAEAFSGGGRHSKVPSSKQQTADDSSSSRLNNERNPEHRFGSKRPKSRSLSKNNSSSFSKRRGGKSY
jgi:hypothetical protein